MAELIYGETYDVSKVRRVVAEINDSPRKLLMNRQPGIARARGMIDQGQIQNFVSARDIVIDIGTGRGHVTELLQEQTGARIYTSDLEDLRTNDTKKDQSFFIANGRKMPLADQSVDVVLMLDLLHHCLRQEELLGEAYRVLRPAGRLVLLEDTIPEVSNPLLRRILKTVVGVEDTILNFQSLGTNPHNLHTISDWQQIISQVGFNQNVDTKFWYWGPVDFIPGLNKIPNEQKLTPLRFFESTRFVAFKD